MLNAIKFTCLVILLMAGSAWAQISVSDVKITGTAGTNVTSFSGNISGLGGVAQPLSVTFSSGATATVTPDGNGNFNLAVPVSDQALGNKATFSYIDSGGTTYSTKPVKWYDSVWIGSAKAAIKVDPAGFPGGAATQGPATQAWTIEGAVNLTGAANGDPGIHTIVGSDINVSYAEEGNSTTYDMSISGNNSYIELDDGTEIDLPNGADMGTIQIGAGCNATNALSLIACQSGSLNFSGIGLSGTWDFNPGSDYTDFTAGNEFSFGSEDPSISAGDASSAPEPSGYILLASGLIVLGCLARRGVQREVL